MIITPTLTSYLCPLWSFTSEPFFMSKVQTQTIQMQIKVYCVDFPFCLICKKLCSVIKVTPTCVLCLSLKLKLHNE